jgi:phage gp16-like protein
MPNPKSPVKTTTSRTYPNAMRNRIIAKIHVAKKQLDLGEDEYRGLIAGATNGKAESCKDCNKSELEQILQLMERRGFTPIVKTPAEKPKVKLSPRTRDKAEGDHEQIDKIRAMWIDLANKGIVRNRSEDAVQAFAKRLTKVDRLEWLNPKQCSTVLAALNAMAKQEPTEPA